MRKKYRKSKRNYFLNQVLVGVVSSIVGKMAVSLLFNKKQKEA